MKKQRRVSVSETYSHPHYCLPRNARPHPNGAPAVRDRNARRSPLRPPDGQTHVLTDPEDTLNEYCFHQTAAVVHLVTQNATDLNQTTHILIDWHRMKIRPKK